MAEWISQGMHPDIISLISSIQIAPLFLYDYKMLCDKEETAVDNHNRF